MSNYGSDHGPPRERRGFRGTAENAKTVMCTRFTSPEGCRFGDRCNFAHTDTELKPRRSRYGGQGDGPSGGGRGGGRPGGGPPGRDPWGGPGAHHGGRGEAWQGGGPPPNGGFAGGYPGYGGERGPRGDEEYLWGGGGGGRGPAGGWAMGAPGAGPGGPEYQLWSQGRNDGAGYNAWDAKGGPKGGRDGYPGGYGPGGEGGATAAPAHGWTTHSAPDGHCYYYNARTGTSQWERPAEMDSPQFNN